MNRLSRIAALLLLTALFALALPAGPRAFAGDEPPVPGPRNLEPDGPAAAPVPAPVAAEPAHFDPRNFDLLPLDDVERLKLYREHPTLATRLTVLANRGKKLQRQFAARKNKNDAGSKKLGAQIQLIGASVGKLLASAHDTLAEYGVTDEVLALVRTAPTDNQYRIERYAHSLVLSIDLQPVQRKLFARVVREVNGATYALSAQRRRLALVAKQIETSADRTKALLRTVDRQLSWNDKRFWTLVDDVLDAGQRLALKERLPTKFQRIQNGLEHLYQLEGITPAQGARAKSLVTEFEAEASPDQALVKKSQQMLRTKGTPKQDRKAAQRDMQQANQRLQGLQIDLAQAFKQLLTEKQVELYKGIMPRLSHVDRRRDFKYLFEGMPFSPAQQLRIAQLKRAHRQDRQTLQKDLAGIRRKGADYGADSPQMEMMQMEMAGVAAKGYAIQRKALGRVFTEILTPDQVSGWVLGYYGTVR